MVRVLLGTAVGATLEVGSSHISQKKIKINDLSIIPLRRPLRILIGPHRFPLSTGGAEWWVSFYTDPLLASAVNLPCSWKFHIAKLTSCQFLLPCDCQLEIFLAGTLNSPVGSGVCGGPFEQASTSGREAREEQINSHQSLHHCNGFRVLCMRAATSVITNF